MRTEAPAGVAFQREILIQEHIRRMLYCVFDLSAPVLNQLTLSRRAWLYDNIFIAYDDGITYDALGDSRKHQVKRIQKHMTFGASHIDELLDQTTFEVDANQPVIQEPTQEDGDFLDLLSSHEVDARILPLKLQQLKTKVDTIHDLKHKTSKWISESLDVSGRAYFSYRPSVDKAPSDTLDALNAAVEYAQSLPDSSVYDEYEIEDLYTLLYLELTQMLKDNLGVKRCKHCGMYFVVTDKKMEYCDRQNGKNNRPCFAEGKNGGYQQKLKDDEFHRVYNRAYKKYHARSNKADFNTWYNNARNLLTLYNRGELNMDIAEFKKRIE
jgi:hypothetical protein